MPEASKEALKKETQPIERPAPSIQDSFLNNIRRERAIVTIFLMGGIKLTGKLKSFDRYSLVLESNNQEQLIFKHAISTVAVSRPTHSVSPTVPVTEA
ncbi:MAG: RNA chaperone Hfq [Acidobacteria bacterium]|nr:RNA chaperone Hfq [Acidobacteriota bacterium]